MADESSLVAQIFDSLEVSIFLKKLLFPPRLRATLRTTRRCGYLSVAKAPPALSAPVTRHSGGTESRRPTGSDRRDDEDYVAVSEEK